MGKVQSVSADSKIHRKINNINHHFPRPNYKWIICELASRALTNQSLPRTLPLQFTTLQLANYPQP